MYGIFRSLFLENFLVTAVIPGNTSGSLAAPAAVNALNSKVSLRRFITNSLRPYFNRYSKSTGVLPSKATE
jgi:hypothetical protein